MMEGKVFFGLGLVLCLIYTAWQVQGAVNCTETGAGRFPDEEDTTCKNYTLCVLNSATNDYLSYDYVCPTTSLFNPGTSQCTTNYECESTTNSTSTTTSASTTSSASTTASTTTASTEATTAAA